MDSEGLTKADLARRFDVSTVAIDGWIRRGCPHERDGNAYAFDLGEVADWRASRLAGRKNPRGRPVPQNAQELMQLIPLPHEQIIPWSHEDLLTLPEWAKAAKLSDDEAFGLLMLGLPVVPPLPGEKLCRVSIPHAKRWLLLLAFWIESLGGDGHVRALASEANWLRGLPQ